MPRRRSDVLECGGRTCGGCRDRGGLRGPRGALGRSGDLPQAALPLLLGVHQLIEAAARASGGGRGPAVLRWVAVALPLAGALDAGGRAECRAEGHAAERAAQADAAPRRRVRAPRSSPRLRWLGPSSAGHSFAQPPGWITVLKRSCFGGFCTADRCADRWPTSCDQLIFPNGGPAEDGARRSPSTP
ncbi:DUF6629 family protein [Streptomyces sp. KMM 9044]|uniref:DUF6629 family protein n=1 Tax=Streptomyces sp. KMM 9044 TaxID=2744474 RepID=UPI002F425522